jgi:hypothetical protein
MREAVEITKNAKNFNRDDGYPLSATWKSLFWKKTYQRRSAIKMAGKTMYISRHLEVLLRTWT